jgi:hypothetical protein
MISIRDVLEMAPAPKVLTLAIVIAVAAFVPVYAAPATLMEQNNISPGRAYVAGLYVGVIGSTILLHTVSRYKWLK